MKLTNRLSLFFLAALALVLVGFSSAMYLLAHWHLHAHMQSRLEAAMNTLLAATELHPYGVEWEPLGRQVTMGNDPALDQVRWTVFDAAGQLVDCSENLIAPETALLRQDEDWRRALRVVSDDLQPNENENVELMVGDPPLLIPEGFSIGQIPSATQLPPDRAVVSKRLVLIAAVAPRPVKSALWHLVLAMFGVSAIIWLTAALWGRWLCRRALKPITQMAISARALRRHPEIASFLDVAPTKDELEDLGRAFNELLVGLREALERQRRFTGDASHQLRTPLTAMLTSVQVASRQKRTPAEYEHVLDVVRRRGLQLQQIIDALLLLARTEVDAPLPDSQEIDLNELCRARVNTWSDHPRASDLVFRPSPDETPLVFGQPVLIDQIIGNLFDNAAKYSEAGTPITVAVDANSEDVILTIADEGCGIPAEELSQICEPFFRAEQAKWNGKPGIGLGLTVVQRLVRILGGRLDVESDVAHGSRFRVSFPRVASHPTATDIADHATTDLVSDLPCSAK
jgi:two-component system, OmpR family, sensor kinase